MIFPNDEAQMLYEKGTPNDVLQKGDHWARLYLGAHGGSILCQQEEGGIDHFVYTDDAAIYDAWLAFERQIEIRQPHFTKDHTIFPVMDYWAWTRPLTAEHDEDLEEIEGTALITYFTERKRAIEEMLSFYDELREWWESDGENWRLMYSAEVD